MFQNCTPYSIVDDQSWILRLKPNDKIWLVKEKCYGVVTKHCSSNYSNKDCGLICAIKFKKADARPQANHTDCVSIGCTCRGRERVPRSYDIISWTKEKWECRPDGTGFDHSQILMPVDTFYHYDYDKKIYIDGIYYKFRVSVSKSEIEQELHTLIKKYSDIGCTWFAANISFNDVKSQIIQRRKKEFLKEQQKEIESAKQIKIIEPKIEKYCNKKYTFIQKCFNILFGKDNI